MTQLPLKIRVGFRDHWEKADSQAQKSISALTQVIGLPVDVTLEAPMLWRELGKKCPDPDTFVPSIVGVVIDWADRMVYRLEDDANAAWTEQLLETCGRNLKARVDTQSGNEANTRWEETISSFIISIPETRPSYGGVRSSFVTDLENLFKEKTPVETAVEKLPVRSQGIDDEGWADVQMPSNRRGRNQQNPPAIPQALPRLDTIARPDTLFLDQIPYHMTMKMARKGIVVQGSHHPSLELLAGYFSKWTRTMKNDTRKIPILKVELQESHFGLGTLFDSVTIEAADERQTWVNVNPILVVGFIEGVLGYFSMTEGQIGDEWRFKRDERYL